VLPSFGGLATALGLALPAWLVYEPRNTGETPGAVLILGAAVGAALVLSRAWAGLRDQIVTRRMLAGGTRSGRRLPDLGLPALRIAHDFPVAAVAGVFRPRLVIADRVVDSLTSEELEAVGAHESGHLVARDNLRSLVLRVSPDPLALTAAGREIRRAWEDAAEAAADRYACSRVAPLVLARALVKVAGLVPAGRRLDLTAAAFHRDRALTRRVTALIAAAESGLERPPRRLPFALVVTAVAVPSAAAVPLLPAVHRVLEAVVRALP
jgi:Zn-dependent protease with chaperone function